MNTINTARHGHTLHELLVVMTAFSIIFTISTGLIHAAMHRQRATQQAAELERTAWRLSHQLRRDLAAATAGVIDGKLTLQLPSEKLLTYDWRNNLLVRTETSAGKTVRRETFAFGQDCLPMFAKLSAPRRVALTLASNQNDGPPLLKLEAAWPWEEDE